MEVFILKASDVIKTRLPLMEPLSLCVPGFPFGYEVVTVEDIIGSFDKRLTIRKSPPQKPYIRRAHDGS